MQCLVQASCTGTEMQAAAHSMHMSRPACFLIARATAAELFQPPLTAAIVAVAGAILAAHAAAHARLPIATHFAATQRLAAGNAHVAVAGGACRAARPCTCYSSLVAAYTTCA
jgi:hypothetical protein